jgi:transposase
LIKKDLDQNKIIQNLVLKVERLTLRVQQLEKFEEENKILRQENATLKTENAELKDLLNRNSRNSNQPPSSDGYKKQPALPKAVKGKKGGQIGHKGRNLQQIENPDAIVECKPEKCSCGHTFTKQDFELAEKRQVFDLPQPKLEITEYQIHKATCPKCGLTHKGIAPNGINAPVQYGNKVKAYAVLLNVHYKLPFKKIQLLFNDLYGYPINESTVTSATEQCYEKLYESETLIKTRITESNVAHADETGMRVAGKLTWLHTASSVMYTYLFVHENRGRLALESDKSVLDKIKGWLVHDCWGSYFNFRDLKHAVCGAHILRELEGLVENEKSKWARVFKSFLMSIYKMPFEERIKRRQLIDNRYKLICQIGEKYEPPPKKMKQGKGRNKRTKGRNLVERLIREQEAVLAFAFNKEVPFTNNLAERDIRPAKVKLKISNCFRTFMGANIYARIEGFVSTTRKHNCNVFSELCNTFEGHNFITG